MPPTNDDKQISMVIDGLEVRASYREPVLAVARRLGIGIPTLCHHDALEPAGACRLCLVEAVWDGRSKFVTACNYPVDEGLEIRTSSEAVLRHRQLTVEALLARCPEVPAIRELAAKLEVGTPRFSPDDQTCILCGLCTRVCATYATAAISPLGRGNDKLIGTFAGTPPEDCVGCGGCVAICPTGHITAERKGGRYHVWDREIPLAVCGVDAPTCVGCGTCEEACPFSIPRVVLSKAGSGTATIDPEACRGCGVCLAACPEGAIASPRAARAVPAPSGADDVMVFACGRSNLGRDTSPPLPAGVSVRELPCVGGVSAAQLLGTLAAGYRGALVLGRHPQTCRLDGAEEPARELVDRIDRLAEQLGLGRGRIRFAQPAPGQDGPLESIESYRSELAATPLADRFPTAQIADTPAGALDLLSWLADRPELDLGDAELGERIANRDRELVVPAHPRWIKADADTAIGACIEPIGAPLGDRPRRITGHPIMPDLPPADVEFTFNGQTLMARPGEMIASALFAAGLSVFGHHHRDGGPQGIFCANGQCSQCTVLADGRPVKSCMVLVEPGMRVESCEGRPALPADDAPVTPGRPDEVSVPVLVLGGGPAGLCAAMELGRVGIEVLVVDDKPELGGKLTLQTHGFFGSVADCWAGTRGVDIGHLLADEVEALPSVECWTSSTVVGIFFDGKVGVATPDGYRLVTPENVLIAMGAREKALSFPGCDLPGIYGAGAFQTLVNRDLVSASRKLFVLGGGNVGLIGAYHALQAGIDVVGLVEALPECGGYKVHADKLKRLGVPIWTGHTVARAEGTDRLERVTIAAIDERFQPIPGTEQTFEADTLLIAVGLSPVDEILAKAREYGLKVYAAGDSEEVAEASAAIFSGRIAGRKLARELGVPVEIPDHWEGLAEVLRSRPGEVEPWQVPAEDRKVYPVIRCVQEIPCNPCSEACPEALISMEGIMGLPEFAGNCLGCGSCVARCPGLAINLVCEDYDPERKLALLELPFEFGDERIPLGQEVRTTDFDGNDVGTGKVVALRDRPDQDRRRLLMVEVPWDERLAVAGFAVRGPSVPIETADDADDDPVVCRCERVRKSEIVREIRAGVRDINQLKALARNSMGGCGGKTCTELVYRIFREEGVPLDDVTSGTTRPLVAEMPLGLFIRGGEQSHD